MTTITRQLFDASTRQTITDWLSTYRTLIPRKHDETFQRTYGHNVPFLVRLHHALVPFASELFGEPLRASYVFLSMYEDGGRCPLHIDRPQCYRTIDYLVQQDDEESWPLHVGQYMTEDRRLSCQERSHPESQEDIIGRIGEEEWDTLLLQPNDAACYSGTHQWHYRSRPSRGRADLIFFHFVQEGFDGPLN